MNKPRSTDAHEKVAAEREPDNEESVERHENDQPGGHVERTEQDEHQQLAADVGHVQHLELRHRPDPDLEGADVENERVGDGEKGEVEVHRSGAHTSTQEHAERQRVADRSHQHYNRNYRPQQRHGQRTIAVHFYFRLVDESGRVEM